MPESKERCFSGVEPARPSQVVGVGLKGGPDNDQREYHRIDLAGRFAADGLKVG